MNQELLHAICCGIVAAMIAHNTTEDYQQKRCDFNLVIFDNPFTWSSLRCSDVKYESFHVRTNSKKKMYSREKGTGGYSHHMLDFDSSKNISICVARNPFALLYTLTYGVRRRSPCLSIPVIGKKGGVRTLRYLRSPCLGSK